MKKIANILIILIIGISGYSQIMGILMEDDNYFFTGYDILIPLENKMFIYEEHSVEKGGYYLTTIDTVTKESSNIYKNLNRTIDLSEKLIIELPICNSMIDEIRKKSLLYGYLRMLGDSLDEKLDGDLNYYDKHLSDTIELGGVEPNCFSEYSVSLEEWFKE